jgi:hypothetical protein
MVWLWPAVGCVRDTVVLLSLIREGRTLYRRGDVLAYIRERFPEHAPVAEAVYQYKLSQDWRQRIPALCDQPDTVLLGELRRQTEALVALWHAAMCDADRAIVRGESMVPFGASTWQEHNHAAYRQCLEEYLGALAASS